MNAINIEANKCVRSPTAGLRLCENLSLNIHSHLYLYTQSKLNGVTQLLSHNIYVIVASRRLHWRQFLRICFDFLRSNNSNDNCWIWKPLNWIDSLRFGMKWNWKPNTCHEFDLWISMMHTWHSSDGMIVTYYWRSWFHKINAKHH